MNIYVNESAKNIAELTIYGIGFLCHSVHLLIMFRRITFSARFSYSF